MIDEQTGDEVKSKNKTIPRDRGHYLEIPLKTKKNKVLIPTQKDLDRFRRDALKRHNYYRKYHCVDQMELTNVLNTFAQNFAETLALKDKAEFSSEREREEFCGGRTGENIFLIYFQHQISSPYLEQK